MTPSEPNPSIQNSVHQNSVHNSVSRPDRNGRLLALLVAGFYALFTLLPDSNSQIVSWPWVLVWQVGWLGAVLWWLVLLWQGQGRWLGHRLDWIVGWLGLGLLISSGGAAFPVQARWHSWTVICAMAALYALRAWLVTPEQRRSLLRFQGYLSLGFVAVSLLLWTSQIWLPEVGRLREMQALGANLPFDFSRIELRNWVPIGHQNYVAGYLVLAIPLLLGLGWQQTGRWRRLWFAGAGLALVDLYTTSSRAGWLGLLLLAIVAFGVLVGRRGLSRRTLVAIGLGGLLSLGLLVLTNNRWRTLAIGLLSGQGGGELAYRAITLAAGWQMGLSHLWTGTGLGSVPLLYQRFRPTWAGREAELVYQLHSTPIHLWAELGIWAVLVGGGAIGLLLYKTVQIVQTVQTRSFSPTVRFSPWLLAALSAYFVVSLTDYQLDNPSISGTLLIYLAILITEADTADTTDPAARTEEDDRPPTTPSPHPTLKLPLKFQRRLALAGLGLLLVAIGGLVPLHRAWLVADQGFVALGRDDFNTFVARLTQAHQIAPWEPYYANQLGWNLGDRSLQTNNPTEQNQLSQESVRWFQQAIAQAPDQEFAHSNLAWLLLNRDPKTATQHFIQAAELVPAKRGVFLGLGLSLLAQGQVENAVAAMTLEILRDPQLLTSPLWRLPQLQPIYRAIGPQLEARYTALLDNPSNPPSEPLLTLLHQNRGGWRWWLGDLVGAKRDLDQFGTPLSRSVLALATGKSPDPKQQPTQDDPPLPGTIALAAWRDPANRAALLQQAWILANRTAPPPDVLQALVDSLGRSTSLDQWLKQNAPSRTLRRERAGFGVLNRHGDGPVPADFLTVVENVPMTQFFAELLSVPAYAPDLDRALQVDRAAFLQSLRSSQKQDSSGRN